MNNAAMPNSGSRPFSTSVRKVCSLIVGSPLFQRERVSALARGRKKSQRFLGRLELGHVSARPPAVRNTFRECRFVLVACRRCVREETRAPILTPIGPARTNQRFQVANQSRARCVIEEILFRRQDEQPSRRLV